MRGIVIKSTGALYTVLLEDGRNLTCRIRGNLRLIDFEATNPLTVGDNVNVEWDQSQDVGNITELFDRKNYIIRKSVKLSKQVQIIAANIDRAWVVATPVLPKTSLGFIDRFLATAEAHSVPAGILWNKADIYDEDVWDFVNELKNLYEGIGYKVMSVSGLTGIGIQALTEERKSKLVFRTQWSREDFPDQCSHSGNGVENIPPFLTAHERNAYNNIC